MEESFDYVRTFAHDLSQAIDNRLDSTTNPASSFFDVGEIFKLLCGKRLPDGRLNLQEGNLEQYGLEEFREFFKEMCNLEHIQKLEDEIFDERMYALVLRSFKDALRRLVWDEKLKDSLVQCFEIVKDSSLEEF